jgi:hypothetical protein
MTTLYDLIRDTPEPQKSWIQTMYGDFNISLLVLERALPYLEHDFEYTLSRWAHTKKTKSIRHTRPYFEGALKKYSNKVWERRSEAIDRYNSLSPEDKAEYQKQQSEMKQIQLDYEILKQQKQTGA